MRKALALLLLLLAGCTAAPKPDQPPLPPAAIPVTLTPRVETVAVATMIPAETKLPTHTPSPQPSPTATFAPVNPGPYQVRRMGGDTGWAVWGTHVLRTTDGGDTWTDVTPPGIPLMEYVSGVAFLGPDTAWYFQPGVIQPDPAATEFTNLRTTDGGKTWQEMKSPFPSANLFADASGALLAVTTGPMDDRVVFYQSKDNGDTWQEVFQANPLEQPGPNSLPVGIHTMYEFAFRNAYRGWILEYGNMAYMLNLYTTGNLGKTWQQINLPAVPGFPPGQFYGVGPMRVFDEQNLAFPTLVGEYEGEKSLVIYLSQDGGVSFHPTSPLPAGFQFGYPSWSAPTLDAWFTSDGKATYASHDQGKTWQKIETSLDPNLTPGGMFFADAQRGWLTARSGDTIHLFRTKDGGKTWAEVTDWDRIK